MIIGILVYFDFLMYFKYIFGGVIFGSDKNNNLVVIWGSFRSLFLFLLLVEVLYISFTISQASTKFLLGFIAPK